MLGNAGTSTARGSGFTLVEIIVVLFIVGVLCSALVVVALPGDAALADKEARRLAALLELALAETRAGGQAIAWSPEGNGYSFLQRAADGEWTRFPDTSVYRHRSFAGKTQIREVLIDSQVLPEGGRIMLSQYGFHSPFQATMSGGEARVILRGGVLGRISLQRIHPD